MKMSLLFLLAVTVSCSSLKREVELPDIAPNRAHDMILHTSPEEGLVSIPRQDLGEAATWVKQVSHAINVFHQSCSSALVVPARTFSFRVGEKDSSGTVYLSESAVENEKKHHDQLEDALKFYVKECRKIWVNQKK